MKNLVLYVVVTSYAPVTMLKKNISYWTANAYVLQTECNFVTFHILKVCSMLMQQAKLSSSYYSGLESQ